MKKLNKISLLATTIALSTIFIGNVAAKTYPEYKIGDKITYKDIDFYVIENSDATKDSVTMLKAEPLLVDEVEIYGAGHINKYTYFNEGIVGNFRGYGYGGMAYYSSETCDGGGNASEGCTTEYDKSDVKYAVDAWAADKLDVNDLKEDKLGYKVRLITLGELESNLGYTKKLYSSYQINKTEETPIWVYNEKYSYWTMSPYNTIENVWYVSYNENLYHEYYINNNGYEAVRPVITLAKTPIEVYYNVDAKTDNNGTINTAKKEALEGEKVTISITANEGYELKSLKIYKTSDNEDITSLVDYNSETNEFVMPDYDVTVSAEFEEIIENKEVIDNQNKIENPKTIDKINMYVIISVLGVGTLVIFMLCKRKWNIK